MTKFTDAVQAGASIYLKFLPVFEHHPELREHLDMEDMTRWSHGRVPKCEITN